MGVERGWLGSDLDGGMLVERVCGGVGGRGYAESRVAWRMVSEDEVGACRMRPPLREGATGEENQGRVARRFPGLMAL
jgi:hypothetical protein